MPDRTAAPTASPQDKAYFERIAIASRELTHGRSIQKSIRQVMRTAEAPVQPSARDHSQYVFPGTRLTGD